MELAIAALTLVSTVPLLLADDLPYVKLDVGGRPVMVRFDSGAWDSGVALPTTDVERTKVIFTGTTRWQDAKGNVLSARKFVIPEIRIGALVLHDVPGHEMVFSPDYAPPRKDGQLGFAFLRNFTVVVDFPGSQLKLYDAADATLPPECGTQVAPLEIGAAGLQSVARTSVGTIRVGWDTAAQVSMLTPATLSVPDSRYVQGEPHELAEFTIGDLKLGPLKVRSVKLQIPGVQGLLGFDFFNEHVVCFDTRRGKVAIAPPRQQR
jgi:hypothetical protein